jgi:hypothetical protein
MTAPGRHAPDFAVPEAVIQMNAEMTYKEHWRGDFFALTFRVQYFRLQKHRKLGDKNVGKRCREIAGFVAIFMRAN